MAEFEEKLNSILGNQKAMEQIMALAHSLGGEGAVEEVPTQEPKNNPEEEFSAGSVPDLSQIFGGVDPRIVQMGIRLIQQYQNTEDKNVALLRALRPFLREKRWASLDRAIQIARVTKVIRAGLSGLGEKGDEPDV